MEPTDQTNGSPPPGRPVAAPKLYRARTLGIVLTAVLTELVVIAAIDNQAVVKVLRKHLDDGSRQYADYTRGGIDALTTFWWRFAPAGDQATHVWAAQFAGIGALVVLTALGCIVVARGSVTFGRVFVAVWAVVAAVAPVSIMVRNLVVVPDAPGPLQSRVGQSVYGYDAFGPVIVAGFALGLIVGLFAALIAVINRRAIRVAVLPDEDGLRDEDGEYLDTTFGTGPRGGPAAPYEPPPWGNEQTTSYRPPEVWPPVAAQGEPVRAEGAPVQQTAQLPVPDAAGHPGGETEQFARAGGETEQFARAGGETEQFARAGGETEQFARPDEYTQPSGAPDETQEFPGSELPAPETATSQQEARQRMAPPPQEPGPRQEHESQPEPGRQREHGSQPEPGSQPSRE